MGHAMNPAVSKLKKIHDCFQKAAKSQPAYQKMLPFFENLYELQESAIAVTHPKSLDGPLAAPEPQKEHGAPLIDRKDFSIDTESAIRLLGDICQTARNEGPKMSHAADILTACIENDDPIILHGFDRFLSNDGDSLQALCQELGIDQPMLTFLVYHSIWPSLASHVEHFEKHNCIDPQWSHPHCPICGSAPNLAYLSENGKRFLVCGFCRHDWPVQRIICPYCRNDSPESISYFYSEEEKAYRVYTCAQCQKYIKTVDTRELSRQFYAPLESLMTLHLDLQAESNGYRGGEDRHLFGG